MPVLVQGGPRHAANATFFPVILPAAIVATAALRRHGIEHPRWARRLGAIGGVGFAGGSAARAWLPASTLRGLVPILVTILGVRMIRDNRRSVEGRDVNATDASAAIGLPDRGIERSRALVDDLAARIQADIMTGRHPIGSWLRQSALATSYGVSRTPIREALRKLQADGLIELRPHAGALVRGPTAREARESYIVRAELEGLAAELAASWITQRQLDELKDTETLFAEAITSLQGPSVADSGSRAAAERHWRDANNQFHDVIHDAAGNARLTVAIRDLHRPFPRWLSWTTLSEDPRLLEENSREHQAIREALDRRAADEARRRMIAHVRRAGELVARWFERQET